MAGAFRNAFFKDFQYIGQTSNVDEYHQHFEAIRALVSYAEPGIPEAYFAYLFINGLHEDFHHYVERFAPLAVIDAYELDCIYEYSFCSFNNTRKLLNACIANAVNNDSDIISAERVGTMEATAAVQDSNLVGLTNDSEEIVPKAAFNVADIVVDHNVVHEICSDSIAPALCDKQLSVLPSHSEDFVPAARAMGNQQSAVSNNASGCKDVSNGDASPEVLVDIVPHKAPAVENSTPKEYVPSQVVSAATVMKHPTPGISRPRSWRNNIQDKGGTVLFQDIIVPVSLVSSKFSGGPPLLSMASTVITNKIEVSPSSLAITSMRDQGIFTSDSGFARRYNIAVKGSPRYSIYSREANSSTVAELQVVTNSFSEMHLLEEVLLGPTFQTQFPGGQVLAMKKNYTVAVSTFCLLTSRLSSKGEDVFANYITSHYCHKVMCVM